MESGPLSWVCRSQYSVLNLRLAERSTHQTCLEVWECRAAPALKCNYKEPETDQTQCETNHRSVCLSTCEQCQCAAPPVRESSLPAIYRHRLLSSPIQSGPSRAERERLMDCRQVSQ